MVTSKGPQLRWIALIGNSPPRLCGIATFTDDVRNGLLAAFPELQVDIYAMNDCEAGYCYPDGVVCSIDQDNLASYAKAAHHINASGTDVVCVQHEYGIFGGVAGSYILKLLDRVTAPVVVTLHTVLERPTPEQRSVIDALARRAFKLVVMAEKGRQILRNVHGVSDDRIEVVLHGVPDRPLSNGETEKAPLRFAGHRILLTFGLLSPNKGIETVIRAMPVIVSRHPDALYVVLGATHPHLVAHEGETYRERLMQLSVELDVSDHVRFIDGFLEKEQLLNYLSASDIYVTPYLNEAQIVSGTLSYAIALGRPVVSTPYWHAVELLADGVGVLVPFGDSTSIAERIIELLDDPERTEEMSRRAWAKGRSMIWSEFARAYVKIFRDATIARPARLFRSPGQIRDVASPRFDAIERLTDACGIVQHSIFSVPDRSHGYCVDDNCRALMLMHRFTGIDAGRADELAAIYAAFVQHAWNSANGRFRNFMAFDRNWLEEAGSEDSFGRTLWSLGVTASVARGHDLRRWALHLFDQVAPHARTLGSPRTVAFSMLAADALLDAHPGHELARALLGDGASQLLTLLDQNRRTGWNWFEPVLAYDNARLPEALLRAGRRFDDPTARKEGIATLIWLDELQTNEDGQFRAIGTDSFGRAYQSPLPFDQQPLEGWATIDAASLAVDMFDDARWITSARRAYGWYLGENDLGLPLGSSSDGSCFDGLMSDRVNLNQGAESVLAFQFACCAMREITEKAQRNRSTIKAGVATS